MSWSSMQGSDLVVNNLTVLGNLTIDDKDDNSLDNVTVNTITNTDGTNTIYMNGGGGNITIEPNLNVSGDIIANNITVEDNITIQDNLTVNSGISFLRETRLLDVNGGKNFSQLYQSGNAVALVNTVTNGGLSLQAYNGTSNYNCLNITPKNISCNTPTQINTSFPNNSGSNSFWINDNTSGQNMNFLNNAGQGSYNPMVNAGDSVIFSADKSSNQSTFDITTWSTVAAGVKVNGTSTKLVGGNNSLTVSQSSGINITGNTVCNGSIQATSFITSTSSGNVQSYPIFAWGSTYANAGVKNCTCSPMSISTSYTITCSNCVGILNVSASTFTYNITLSSINGNTFTWTVNLYNHQTNLNSLNPQNGYIYFMII